MPDDLSVVGFDDIPEASLVMSSLTTVRQPLKEMGATAVRLLQRLVDEPDTPPLGAPCSIPSSSFADRSTAPPAEGSR